MPKVEDGASNLVPYTQTLFIKGISFVHNMLICLDFLKQYNRKTSPRFMMNIDLCKAYDMVKWEFIDEMLKWGNPYK